MITKTREEETKPQREREREKREKVGGDGGAADDPVLGFRKFELVRVVGGEWGSRGTDGTGR